MNLDETKEGADSALVPASKRSPTENFGARSGVGAGRIKLSPRERMIQRAGQRFLREKLVPRALRRLAELLESTDEGIARLACKEVLGRGGFPISKEITADFGGMHLTPEALAKAWVEAAQRAQRNPAPGDVIATDAEYEEIPNTNGNATTVQ